MTGERSAAIFSVVTPPRVAPRSESVELMVMTAPSGPPALSA
jgi:hypothetical protein